MTFRPSFQFYPQDWGDDPGLQMCSLAARGLWIEMLRLMHKGTPYGHLQLNGGAPVTPERLAQYVRSDLASVTSALQELESGSVYSKNDNGIIFSRRMVRDEELRRQSCKRMKKHRVKEEKGYAPVTPMLQLSSSSSSSSSSILKEKRGIASRSPRHDVYWEPEPVWKKGHDSLDSTSLHVVGDRWTALHRDYPRINIASEILKLQSYARDNPAWAKAKRDWRRTLGNWLRRADERFEDERFKAKGGKPTPAGDAIDWEAQEERERDGAVKKTIDACTLPHARDKLQKGGGGKFLFCPCGYIVAG